MTNKSLSSCCKAPTTYNNGKIKCLGYDFICHKCWFPCALAPESNEEKKWNKEQAYKDLKDIKYNRQHIFSSQPKQKEKEYEGCLRCSKLGNNHYNKGKEK